MDGQAQLAKPSFFKRHSKLISLIGALIVFGTFVAKEGIRDRLKDHVSAIDGTLQREAVRDDIADSEESEERITEQLDSIQKRLALIHPDPHHDLEDQDYMDSQEERSGVAEIMHDADRFTEMVKPLTGGSIFDPRISKLRSQGGSVSRELLKYEEMPYPSGFETSAVDIANSEKSRRDKEWAHSIVASDVRGLLSADGMLHADILKAATRDKEDSEKSFVRWTWVGYALYTLGWGLALIGRVYGGGDPVTVE